MALGNDEKDSRKRVETARHSEIQPTLSGPSLEFQGGRNVIGYQVTTPHKENSEMLRTLIFVSVLASVTLAAPLEAAVADPAVENQRQAARTRQQDLIKTLSRRGLSSNYQQLDGAAKLHSATSATTKAGQTIPPEFAETISREAAINLAALGFTSADVATYSKRNIDLFDIVYRVFTARGTSAEQMLMADTVLVVKAGTNESARTRSDSFLSATPFTVVKSLKGTRAAGDIVYVPQDSGVGPDGKSVKYSHELNVTPGATYLLVLSKNLYEQRVAQQNKQPERGFNAMVYLAYQVADDGTLLPTPKPPRTGGIPKDIKAVEKELEVYSLSKNKAGSGA